MESNWRFNVWETGWSQSEIRLAACRLPGDFPQIWVLALNEGNPFYAIGRRAAPEQMVTIEFLLPVPVFNRHFPFGESVFPD